MNTDLSDLLRQQADLAPEPRDVAARIRGTISRRRARRRTVAITATAVAAAAAIAVPSLLKDTPAQPQSPLVGVAAAGPSTLPSDPAVSEPPPSGNPGAPRATVVTTPVAETSTRPAPAGPTPIVLTTAPVQPGSAVSVGLTPRGWSPAPPSVTDYLSDGRPGALTIFTTGADAAEVRDLRSTLWLQLTTATGSGDQPLADRIGRKRAAVTAPDARGGWAVLIDEGDGLRSSLNFPSALDELSREQVEQIAQSVIVHDRGQITVG